MCVSPLTFLEWLSVAKSRRRRSGSMAITNKSGERGSPCRRPLPCFRGVLGTSLSKNLEVEVARSEAIQSRHLGGKPNHWRSVRK